MATKKKNDVQPATSSSNEVAHEHEQFPNHDQYRDRAPHKRGDPPPVNKRKPGDGAYQLSAEEVAEGIRNGTLK